LILNRAAANPATILGTVRKGVTTVGELAAALTAQTPDAAPADFVAAVSGVHGATAGNLVIVIAVKTAAGLAGSGVGAATDVIFDWEIETLAAE
jgi:hypothetical protein